MPLKVIYCGDKTVYDMGSHGQEDEASMCMTQEHTGRMTRSPESACMTKFTPRAHRRTERPQRDTAPEEREKRD